jgi:hypothetical protein
MPATTASSTASSQPHDRRLRATGGGMIVGCTPALWRLAESGMASGWTDVCTAYCWTMAAQSWVLNQ